MEKLLAYTAFCLLILVPNVGRGQLIHVPLATRIENAQLVVEGQVVESRSYYGRNQNIYTSHAIAVTKKMKGLCADTLEIVLQGGAVDGALDMLSHYPSLGTGQMGVFFLSPSRNLKPVMVFNGAPAFDFVAGVQGFIHYKEQLGETVASEPFRCYHDIEQHLYPLLGWKHGGAPLLHAPIPERTLGGPIIDSIRPLVATAGTRTEISIHGRGFLDTRGKVYFLNASDGGATQIPTDTTDILEWSDTLVRTWVPSVTPLPPPIDGPAGTGPVTIQNTNGDSAQSHDILQIPFAVANRRNFQNGVSRYATLIDLDSLAGADTSGGYTLHLSSGFATNNDAAIAFRKAIRTWRCATGVNFKVGADTAYDVIANDSICIVKWDDGPDSLPLGVLGLTVTRIRPCVDGAELGYFLQEVEFIFSRNQNWNFDTLLTDSTKWDFNSTALHEIGHGHLLFHVLDAADLMNWELDLGANRRVVTASALAGGEWIMDSSIVSHGTCPAPMAAVAPGDCNMLPMEEAEMPGFGIALFPNPTFGSFEIDMENATQRFHPEITMLDAMGRELGVGHYSLQDLGNGGTKVSCNGVSPGFYFVRVQLGNQSVCKKLILQQ